MRFSIPVPAIVEIWLKYAVMRDKILLPVRGIHVLGAHIYSGTNAYGYIYQV